MPRELRLFPFPVRQHLWRRISISGLPTDAFAFYGFLPSRSGKRKQFLATVRDEAKTLVFYESPKRLMESFRDIGEVLGDRNVVVLREMTKVFEEVIRGTVREVINQLRGRAVKGEVTLVIGRAENIPFSFSDAEILAKYVELEEEFRLFPEGHYRKTRQRTGNPPEEGSTGWWQSIFAEDEDGPTISLNSSRRYDNSLTFRPI